MQQNGWENQKNNTKRLAVDWCDTKKKAMADCRERRDTSSEGEREVREMKV